MNNKLIVEAYQTLTKQCLGALYTAYTRDHRRMKNLFIKAHGLTQDVADAVIAFGERDSQKI